MALKRCFSIEAKGADAELYIYDQIGKDTWDDSGIESKAFIQELKALGNIKHLTIRINSPGGSVFQGLHMYNALRSHPARKTVYIDSVALSIASCIAMAGDEVIMASNSMLMLHDPFATATTGTAPELRKMAETLDKVKQSIVSAYTSKTGKSEAEISALMEKETWLTSVEALNLKFCDRIAEAQRIAASFDLSHFKNKPINLGGNMANEPQVNDTWKKDMYHERDRVTNIMAIAREFKVSNDVTERFITEGRTEDELRQHVLSEIKSKSSAPISFSHIGSITPNHDGKPFRNFGEQLQSIAASARGRVDHRLFEIQNAVLGANESVPSEGGFLLQQDFSSELITKVNEVSSIASLCKKIQISSGANSIKIPMVDESSRATGSRWGGITSAWVNEGGTISTSKPKFRAMEMSLCKLVGACYATDELLADTNVLQQVIQTAFSQELAFQVDNGIINGTGAGQLLGFLNADCLVSIAKEVGQTADTLLFENVSKMWSRLPARSRKTAVWLINQNVEPQLVAMGYVIGAAGYPVYLPPQGISVAPYNTIFGRPVIPVEQCPTLGDVGDICLIDPQEYVLIEKGGINVEQSIHVAFLTDQSLFRFVFRINGQPSWHKPLTPFKGSDQISPFLVIAERA